MAWRSIGELAGDVMQRVKAAAAEQGNAATALAPAARRGNCGDDLLREECDSPSPMRNSREGGTARAIGMRKTGSGKAPGKWEVKRQVKEPCPAPKGRPVMPRLLIAGMGMTRARNAPIRRPKGVARVSPMLVLVWDADRHAARAGRLRTNSRSSRA